MKYERRLNHLNSFLNIILVLIVLISLMYFSILPTGESINIMRIIFETIIQLTILGGYIIIIITLKKVIKSLLNKDPFSSDNIIYFKRISSYIFIIGIIYGIATYPAPTYSRLEIMATTYGSLKPSFFIYILLGFISFILGDIFRIGKEIKDENDLTV